MMHSEGFQKTNTKISNHHPSFPHSNIQLFTASSKKKTSPEKKFRLYLSAGWISPELTSISTCSVVTTIGDFLPLHNWDGNLSSEPSKAYARLTRKDSETEFSKNPNYSKMGVISSYAIIQHGWIPFNSLQMSSRRHVEIRSSKSCLTLTNPGPIFDQMKTLYIQCVRNRENANTNPLTIDEDVVEI